MDGVKIGDEFLDPPFDAEIAVELNLGIFDEEVIPGSLTFPNNFPATERNNRIFKHSHHIDVAPKIDILEGVFYLMGNPIDRCKVLRLESTKDVHRVSIILNGLSVDLKGMKIKDIKLDRFNASFDTLSELVSYMNDCNQLGADSLFVWPRIRNSKGFEGLENAGYLLDHFDGILNRWTSATEITPYSEDSAVDRHFPRYFFSPKIRELILLKSLFAQFGYSIEGTFVNDPEQNELSFYTNRLVKCDRRDIIQVSTPIYNGEYYTDNEVINWPGYSIPFESVHMPTPSVGQTVSDQDYNSAVDIIPGRTKILVEKSRKYRVGAKGVVNTTATAIAANIFIMAPVGPNGTFTFVGMYPVFITFVTPEQETAFEFSTEIDLPNAPSIWDLPNELAIVVGIQTPSDPNASISDFIVQVAEVTDSPQYVIEPLEAAQFLPDITVEDWLISLKSTFNLRFGFNPFNKSVIIDYKSKSLNAPITVVDARMSDDVPLKTITRKTGYTYSFPFDSAPGGYSEDKISALTRDKLAGYSPDDVSAGNRLYASPVDGMIYRHVSISSPMNRYFYGDQVIGDGSTQVEIPSRVPMLMDILPDDGRPGQLQPFIEMPLIAPRYEQIPEPLQFLFITYYRGFVENQAGTATLPAASSLATAPNGDSIGNIELWFNSDRPKSLYNLFFRRWNSFENTTERLRDLIELDFELIQKFYTHQFRLLNTVFVPDKLLFTVKSGVIDKAEVEMYRNNYEYEPPQQ